MQGSVSFDGTVASGDLQTAALNPDTTCLVCAKPHSFRWTDTHGVGACYSCGAPHTIFHYDENKERLDKAPAIALNEFGLLLAKRYWAETQRMVFPGQCDMGVGRNGTTYSGATEDDISAFYDWLDVQPEVVAKAEAASA